MSVHEALATGLLQGHPADAARVLDVLPEEDVPAVLRGLAPDVAAEALRHLAPHRAASVLARLDRSHAARILTQLGPDLAAAFLRRAEPDAAAELVRALDDEPGRAVGTLLRYPEGTAGALMDPRVLALPADLTAQEAHEQIRRSPEHVRYNLYVVDRDQKLVGVLNLRELLLARRGDLLRDIARPDVLSIPAHADRAAVVSHPAWVDARSVPVVDGEGVYLGAVRYRTMRLLEEELRRGAAVRSEPTVEALGELFSTGIAGVFGALCMSVARPLDDGGGGEP